MQVDRHPARARAKEAFSSAISQSSSSLYDQTDQDGFWSGVAKSKFVLSPPGFGEDCYRTWEAVLLGAVPIVRRSPLQQLYDGAPVVVVDVRVFSHL